MGLVVTDGWREYVAFKLKLCGVRLFFPEGESLHWNEVGADVTVDAPQNAIRTVSEFVPDTGSSGLQESGADLQNPGGRPRGQSAARSAIHGQGRDGESIGPFSEKRKVRCRRNYWWLLVVQV